MLGVVVWSKEPVQAAVVWCEDHGDIAYLSGYGGLAEQPDYLSLDPAPPRWPAAGDLVTLDTTRSGEQRLARNLAILEADWGLALPASLRDMAERMGIADPAPRPAWRPSVPAFPPAPFAPVPAGQGMMPPAARQSLSAPDLPQAAPAPAPAEAAPIAEQRWRRGGLG